MKHKMTPKEWMELVEEQRNSVLSAAEFARQNKINPSTYQFWKKSKR